MNKILSSFLDLKCPWCGKHLELKIKKQLLAYDVPSSSRNYAYFRTLIPYFRKLSREDKVPVCSCLGVVVFWTPQAVSTVDLNKTVLSDGGMLDPNGTEYLSKLKEYYNEQIA